MKASYGLIFFIFSALIIAQPKIEIVGGYQHDWGDVRLVQSPLRTRAILKNSGDEPLRIFQVQPACGCTTAPLSKDVIMPGDSAHLDIKLEVKKPEENMEKIITIMTNDPVNKNIKYTLKANVTTPIEKYPNKFAFNKGAIGEELKAGVALVNKTDKPIKILRISKTHDFINLTISEGKVIPPKGEIFVEASFKSDKAMRLNGSIAIATDNLDMPRVNIPMYGIVE